MAARARAKCALSAVQNMHAVSSLESLIADTDNNEYCSRPLSRENGLVTLLASVHGKLAAFADATLDACCCTTPGLLDVTAVHASAAATQLALTATEIINACGGRDAPRHACTAAELAAGALCALAERPVAHEPLLRTAGVSALMALLQLGDRDILGNTGVDAHTVAAAVATAAHAVAALASDDACRAALRAGGGVGVLTRLLRTQGHVNVAAAAARALAALSSRDAIVRECVRYTGAIPTLVAMLSWQEHEAVETARYACQHASTLVAKVGQGAVSAAGKQAGLVG